MAVSAYVLIQIEMGKAGEVASRIREIDGVDTADIATGPYDIIVCVGLLHHLDDDEATRLIRSLAARLSERGRLVTCDPVFVDRQHPVARTLKRLDSGQNIRRAEGYAALFETGDEFALRTEVASGKLYVPYNHCCNVLGRAA